MKTEMKRVKTLPALSFVLMISAVAASAWMMKERAGLVDGLDFGPGQYYYTDIPDWAERFARPEADAAVTVGFIAISLLWGFAMYRLWKRMK